MRFFFFKRVFLKVRSTMKQTLGITDFTKC